MQRVVTNVIDKNVYYNILNYLLISPQTPVYVIYNQHLNIDSTFQEGAQTIFG